MPEERRLAAIMFTDIVGYTALMGKDEDRAFEILRINKEIHTSLIEKHHGTLIKEMGDGILVSFNSSSDAVRCAIDIQAESKRQGIPLKIGIHEGEMVFAGDDVLGDGVNIASRLQDVTESGTITVSEAIYRNIRNKPGIYTAFLEEKLLKNVDEPVKVYQVSDQEIKVGVKKPEKPEGWIKRTWVYVITAAGVLLIAAVLLWRFLPGSEKNVSSSEVITDKSIAVLPFINDSPDPNNEYFCNGMMDVIITHLQKVGDLLVKSRTSVEQYRDRTKDIETIGKELKVAYVLEGSVGKIGDNYRINAQLIDTKTGNHLWAEYYDDKLTENIFEYQSELAKKVVASLHAVLTPDEQRRIEKRPTEHAESWDLIQNGNEIIGKYWESNSQERRLKVRQLAFNLYNKALEIDPDYSEAYGSIGWAYRVIGEPDSAMIYLDKALLLDPENIRAYMTKASIYQRKGNTDQAIEYFSKAVELAPNDFWANWALGNLYNGLNDFGKGLPYIMKAIKNISGQNRDIYAAIGLYFLNIGYFEKAEKYLRITLTLSPRCLVQELTWVKAVQGKFDEAQHFLDSICPLVDCDNECIPEQFYVYYSQEKYNEAEQFFIHWAESPLKIGHRGPLLFLDSLYFANVLLQLGKKQEAYFIINKCKALSEKHISEEPNRSDLNLDLATIHAFRDEKEESLIYLSKAVDLGLGWKLYYTPFDPSFKNLWNDPEFKAIIKRDQDKKAAVRAEIKKMEERGEIDL